MGAFCYRRDFFERVFERADNPALAFGQSSQVTRPAKHVGSGSVVETATAFLTTPLDTR